MEWQPIETAPKDGSIILVIDANEEKPRADIAHWGLNTFRASTPDCWGDNELALEIIGEYISLTHWMPLPDPPSK